MLSNKERLNCTDNLKAPFFGRCLLTFLIVFFLVSCGSDDTKVVLTTGFSKNEVFKIGSEVCTTAEFMVYLTTVQNQYEEVYGEKIWNSELDGMTLEENVKDTVLARIAQIKTMYLLALNKGVELNEEELSLVESATQEYYASLNEKERELLEVDVDTIEKLYREYALADKVYKEIIRDINPEISDDEARIIKVQHIYFATSKKTGSGVSVQLGEREKSAIYDKALEVWSLAVDGEHDFEQLASQYSDDSAITISFGTGEMSAPFEKAGFGLSTDEISEVFEDEAGYHIIKCISTFDREETDENKLKIVEKRKRQVFSEEYDEFVSTLVWNLNESKVDEITFITDEDVNTSNFFDIYEKYFGELS
ncbi:MAG: peptidylprolyl isomerase [Lachnospiraceae bacterium]|nr:peptidylprolyl isomerase [Lachnospiraceae bacterium]